jgi:histidine triad (HIT) family protein
MDCLFCRIVNKEIPCEALLEDEDILAFKDIAPKAPFHALVVPRRHVATLNDLEEADFPLISRMMRAAVELARREGFHESGYRVVMNCNREGGQEVFHLHLHLLGGGSLGGMA